MKKKNSDAKDIPIGLLMSLAQHQKAMRNFSLLNDEKQTSVIRYVEDSRTGTEARERISNAVNGLEEGNTGFID